MKSKGNLLFIGGIVAVLTLVLLGYFFILGPSTAPPPPALPPPPVEPIGAQLARADGAVEIRIAGGEWQSAAIGTPVGANDSLRTLVGASAAIGYGDDLQAELLPDSQITIENLDEDEARFIVKEGLLVVDVRPESGRMVRIRAENSDVVTETRDGRVHVLSDGKGNVQTAVTRGTADVTAHGETVELVAGYQTTVARGKAPSKPVALPKSLLLKIKWPPKASTAKKRHLVSGSTTPGARVRVGAQVVTADRRGRFKAIVELREGENRIRAYTLDVQGRITEGLSPSIRLDTRGPGHAVETNPGMWRKKAR